MDTSCRAARPGPLATLLGAGLAEAGHGAPAGLEALRPTTVPELLDYF